LEQRLDGFQDDLHSIKGSVAMLVHAFQQQQQPFLQPVVPHSPISDNSSPASPGRFSFRCPICTKPQYTPKSHCGHIRKLVDGTGYCCMRGDVPFHAGIMTCFGNVQNFVSWYTPFMRSSVGAAFTDDDISDYQEVQLALQDAVTKGKIMYT